MCWYKLELHHISTSGEAGQGGFYLWIAGRAAEDESAVKTREFTIQVSSVSSCPLIEANVGGTRRFSQICDQSLHSILLCE